MTDRDDYKHHISQQFNQDLAELRRHLMEMGGLAQQMVEDATRAMIDADSARAERVMENDEILDNMEMSIDEECVRLIARRQPAASDLRLVIATSKAITDLERIGDEATKVARQAVKLIQEGEAPRGYVEVRHIGGLVSQMLYDALDAFTRLDVAQAMKVVQQDKTVDLEYNTAMREIITVMMEDPRSISRALSILWSLRALERIGDHARNLGQYVVYLVEGEDVRHANSAQKIQQQLRNDASGAPQS